jgi:hypothetical protein
MRRAPIWPLASSRATRLELPHGAFVCVQDEGGHHERSSPYGYHHRPVRGRRRSRSGRVVSQVSGLPGFVLPSESAVDQANVTGHGTMQRPKSGMSARPRSSGQRINMQADVVLRPGSMRVL